MTYARGSCSVFVNPEDGSEDQQALTMVGSQTWIGSFRMNTNGELMDLCTGNFDRNCSESVVDGRLEIDLVRSTPAAPTSCGSIGAKGACHGEALSKCVSGVLEWEDCAEKGLLCSWDDNEGAYGCL